MNTLLGGVVRTRSFLIIFALFVLLSAGRVFTSLPWCDEGWFFDPPYNWINHGHTGVSVEEATGLPWEGIERHMYWQPPMHLLVHTAWLRLFGQNLFSFRFCSLVAGIIAFLMWRYLLDYSGLDKTRQLAVLCLIATDYTFVRGSADGRTDMLSAAFGLGALVSYLHFRDKSFGRAIFQSQFLAVCAGLTHPIGALIALGMISYQFIMCKDYKKLRPLHVLSGLAPYAAGAVGWGAYILQEPETFRRIFLGSSTAGRLSGILNPLLALKREFLLRYLTPFGLGHSTSFAQETRILIPIIYIASAIAALLIPGVRRRSDMRFLFAMWTVSILIIFIFDSQRNGTYLMHVFPLYAALLVAVLFWVWEQRRMTTRVIAGLVFAGFWLLQIGGTAYIIATNPYRNDFMAAVQFAKQNAPTPAHIVGTVELGFGLGFDGILDDLTLGYNNGKIPDVIILNPRYKTWFEGFRISKPDVYAHITRTLSKYRRAFASKNFEVYLPEKPLIRTGA